MGYAAPDERIVLTTDDYESIGGMTSALSIHADEALLELSTEQQRVAQHMFKRLSNRTPGKPDTRAPARVHKIASIAKVEVKDVIAVADAFRRADRCFMTPRAGEPLNESSLLDISHESLIRQWRTLSTWVKEESEAAAAYARLKDVATLWKRGDAALWGSPDLDRALEWRERTAPSDDWAERYGQGDHLSLALEFLSRSEEKQRADTERARAALEQKEAARKDELKRARRFAFGAGSMAALVLATFFTYYLLEVRISTSYFEGFVEVWGVPQGVGSPLSMDSIKHRGFSYKITRHGIFGAVVRMDAVDAQDSPTTVHDDLNVFYVDPGAPHDDVSWEYSYDDDHHLNAVVAYDANRARVWGIAYSRGKGVVDSARLYAVDTSRSTSGGAREAGASAARASAGDNAPRARGMVVTVFYAPSGFERERWYQDGRGNPKRGRDHAFGQRREFTPDGRLSLLTSLDDAHEAMNDDYGNATMRITYDTLGHEKEHDALDRAGMPTNVVDGWSIHQFENDMYGNAKSDAYFDSSHKPVVTKAGYHRVTRELDAARDPVETAYWNVDGKPARGPDGCAKLHTDFDAHGNLLRQMCGDADGGPALNKYGCAGWTQRWLNGHIVQASNVDANGKECFDDRGVATTKYVYDGARLAEVTHVGVEGKVVEADGYPTERRSYDSSGNVTRFEYFAADGSPFTREEGYARTDRIFDDSGNLIEAHYFDAGGEPVFASTGIAGTRSRYDPSGNRISIAYLGLHGEHVIGKEGVAGWNSEYDAVGNETKVSNFDVAEAPTVDSDGVAGWSALFEHGRRVSLSFFDVKAQPALHHDGYYGWRAAYDPQGNQTRLDYLNKHGEPALYHWDDAKEGEGYASRVTVFNDRGDIIEDRFLGLHGQAVLCKEGYARVVNAVDDRGCTTESKYFGVYGEPSVGFGCHRVKSVFDDRGNATEVDFFGANGEPMVTKEGYSRLLKRYDARSRWIEQYAYRDGTVMARLPGGCHRTIRQLDDRGQILVDECRDEHGALELNDEGFAVKKSKYDLWGHEIESRYEGANGELVPTRGRAIERMQYDSRGNLTRQEFLGLDGRPTIASEPRCAAVTLEYDKYNHLSTWACFDLNSKPLVDSTRGCSRLVTEFDSRGNEVTKTCLGADGHRTLSSENFARRAQAWNEQGQLVSVMLFDQGDHPIVGSDGYAALKFKYDDDGRVIDQATYDESGHLRVSKVGVAHLTRRYDEHGNVIEESSFGGDGHPVGGVALTAFTYDDVGNAVQENYFAANGKGFAPLAQTKATYDPLRRRIEESHFDASGRPAQVAGLQHTTRFEYDDFGHLVGENYFGLHDEPCEGIATDGSQTCRHWVAKYGPDGKRTFAGCASP